jgi:hypothetical protein
VGTGLQRWGGFDSRDRTVQVHEAAEPGDEDLLDYAAVQTFLNDGTVYAVEPQKVPGSGPLAAVFRY